MTDGEERRARAALTALVEPGDLKVWDAVERVGAAELVRRIAANSDRHLEPFDLADRLLERAGKAGVRLVLPGDREWPHGLDALLTLANRQQRKVAGGESLPTIDRTVAPPVALWLRGQPRLAETVAKSVAIVGSRAASGYGTHVAGELAYGLADRGWTVVSGGAYGIDGAAHKGAMAADGPTVAVLASGADVPYPPGHASLFEKIAVDGLLLSEWPPGTTPQRPRFLVRNRVIAALTAGTVVVEAGVRSGAKQTARRAYELGRALMAVPGPVTVAGSVGCHELVRGPLAARLVTRAEEVLEEVGRIGADLTAPLRAPKDWRDTLDAMSSAVVEAMPAVDWMPLDDLRAAVPVAAARIEEIVAGLAVAGRLERDGTRVRFAAAGRADSQPRVVKPVVR
ncbi:DNA-processing protein DprA [Fodinicola acaciae]|uniref:DNA-processing protein DprA n=1 Tax=Fodinicola acaciae TaxID=2681555 RepID=UPI0013D27870|nr:DNA-processing protein DprA [Fodinicola acaciae]